MIKVYNGTTGKMAGTSHISVQTGDPETCKRCKVATICYAARYQRLRPVVKESYRKNGLEITSRIFEMDELPIVTNFQCRFDAFGEIYDGEKGDIQLTNYINIATKNPKVNFVLWSRNYKKIEKYFTENMKPDNFKLIRSSSEVDKPVYVIPNKHIWDGVFSVVSAQYIKDNNVKLNCGTKDEYGEKYSCVSCPTRCYSMDTETVVFEQVK